MTHSHIHFPCVLVFYPAHLTADSGEIVVDLLTQSNVWSMSRKRNGHLNHNSGEQWGTPRIYCGERSRNPVEGSTGIYCTKVDLPYFRTVRGIERLVDATLS